jgi:xanthine/CO dehydrogenase XdhC/CoxF family maturation factor
LPELELLDLRSKLERDRLPYCLATVVCVRGSASAKPGSKMVISREGKNLLGWVGGGCAESFTITNALEAIQERRPRLITADLDDEVFGLGMPCGGTMDIFLEPIHPAEVLVFEQGSPLLRALAERFHFEARLGKAAELSPADCVRSLARAIALSREKSLSPLFGSAFTGGKPTEFLVLGHSRITEELAKLGALLGWNTRIYGLGLDPSSYPASSTATRAKPDYAGLDVKSGSFVVVASHHKGDHHYLSSALQAGAAYVGLVSSRKRAGLVFADLEARGFPRHLLSLVHSPAGLDLGARNPEEIALSIVAELIRAGESAELIRAGESAELICP